VASADLLRVLHLDAAVQVDPLEPPHVRILLIDVSCPLEELLATAIANRPELAASQAQLQATLAQVRQERFRPLLPNLVIRGASTNPAGTLGAGLFAGGQNARVGDTGARLDVDVQLLWQLDNLGFGNRARVEQRRAENQQAQVELLRLQDRVAAEVSQAYAQARLAAQRVELAERGLPLAVESAEKNLAGLSHTKRAADVVLLVVRPQEAVASVQALAQAYADYYGAIADANRAQFRLYRALGKPAQLLLTPSDTAACEAVRSADSPPSPGSDR
jgi:outer membrane protein TolC